MLGRVDLVPSDIFVAEHTIHQLGLTLEVERLSRPIQSVPSYIGFSKRRGLLVLRDQFDRQLSEMKANGAYAAILRRHGIQFYTPYRPPAQSLAAQPPEIVHETAP